MGSSSIEWTDFTLNPGIYGCSRFGAGCDNCYAIPTAKGLEDKARGIAAKNPDAPPSPYNGVSDGTDWTGPIRIDPVDKAVARILGVPKARNGEIRSVFVTSMSDFLHTDIPLEWIVTNIIAMAQKPDHRWLALTKRGQRWPDVVAAVVERLGFWPRNVWIGLSVAHQPDARLIRHLTAIRVPAVRFLSIEPLVGPVVLEPEHLAALDWIIVGGESGPNARPMHPDWVRSLRDQCQVAGVYFFFKQWGEWAPDPISGIGMIRVGKKRAGRILDGREWSEVPRG